MIIYIFFLKEKGIGRFGRTSGFSTVTNEEYVCVWRKQKGRLFQVTGH